MEQIKLMAYSNQECCLFTLRGLVERLVPSRRIEVKSSPDRLPALSGAFQSLFPHCKAGIMMPA